MPVTFSFRWNWDYQNQKTLPFDYAAARKLLKAAILTIGGSGGFKQEIDTGVARVIAAPHKTPGGDSRMHMTVHCKTLMATYHVYISKNGNCTEVSQEPVSGMKLNPGNVKDDFGAPKIANSAAL